MQPYLMDEVGEVEGALLELTHDHQLRVKVGDHDDICTLCYLFGLLVTD